MLIILDIDGVLLPASGWKSPAPPEDGFPMFSKKAVSALQRLLSYDPTIVLSSSHRDRYSIDQWKKIFRVRGLNVKNLVRLEPHRDLAERTEEILEWFDNNPIDEGFVIIDDDTNLYALPQDLRQHLVITSPLIGLTTEHIPQVEAILGKTQA